MIRFDHVTKTYKGTKRPALNSIDLEILRGEFVFLVGASGSGKSSFLRLILKEDRPTSGNIHVLGQDLNAISNRKVPYFRRNLGVVFQDFRLLPSKNVFDNVAFTLQVIGKSRGFIQEAVPDVLQMVGLAEKANRLPHELSGGEQQRVAIARAVVNKPAILLADEPTGNLDPSTSAGIMTVLERINAGGTTVVMATHDNAIVDHMKRRVIELVTGQIVRDEDQGAYGMTAEIALQDSGLTAEIALSEGLARPVGPAQPHVAPPRYAPPVPTSTQATPVVAPPPMQPVSRPVPASQPVPVQQPVSEPVTVPPTPQYERPVQAAPAPNGAQTAPAQTGPVVPAGAHPGTPPMPVNPPQPDPHDPATESLTLAEKLGLRAPGAPADPAKDQNVGPTT
ncbi:cell division ATP-binding protein FtsE [Herbiconiux ginsengi]|uniref:Cell division ATP-binding protein FtsE n=1 Tax=Herbiconiux ginsengi TaxID=381665 RepID=A0A1H3Q6L2_9MICO|nr:cell division ATP-binding protein FtsE [Herbiconiux ginsengi]SDZ08821.1 cell division transport system ATP-binding protein [Herbiconiux ginsengi]